MATRFALLGACCATGLPIAWKALCWLRRRCGCMDFPPLLLDLEAVRDDDHVLAVFRQQGHWGAIAKSNYSGLRFREPVYRNLRELAMSYFEHYFNAQPGEDSPQLLPSSESVAVRSHRLDDRGR